MLPPRLPDPVPPARHEIPASYLRRLATLHGLEPKALWHQVTRREDPRSTRRAIVPERLVALTGRRLEDLAGAMPELRSPAPTWAMFRHQPQPGCQQCNARHSGGQVIRLLPHHRYVCVQHQKWIGPPDIDLRAADLTQLPAIVDAQRRHLRILRRHGWAATYDAVLTSLMICGHIWSGARVPDDPGHVWHTWDARAHILIPDEAVWESFSASRLFAAVYPEAIGLATLIASPRWRRLAGGTDDERRYFDKEISQRVTYPYNDRQEFGDAIAHWAHTDSWRPPSEPLRTYSPGRASALIASPHKGSIERQSRSALWFGRNRRAGSALLHHRHLTPVLERAWNPKYERIEGAIWHSKSTGQNLKENTARERAASTKPR